MNEKKQNKKKVLLLGPIVESAAVARISYSPTLSGGISPTRTGTFLPICRLVQATVALNPRRINSTGRKNKNEENKKSYRKMWLGVFCTH
jgi:hypothetical protein